jgi:hypothetical protein
MLPMMTDDRALRLVDLCAELDRRDRQLGEAWDEVLRLRGENERLQIEKHDLAEQLMRMGKRPDMIITLQEARDNIGRSVVYVPRHGFREDGRISSVNNYYVFVRYRNGVAATRPEDLEWLLPGSDPT